MQRGKTTNLTLDTKKPRIWAEGRGVLYYQISRLETYEATKIKTPWCLYKEKWITQWSWIEYPATGPHMKTLFMTKANCRAVGKKGFSLNDIKCIGYLNEEKVKLDSYLTPYTKVNPKLIVAVNMKGESINLLEESRREYFFLKVGIGKDFLNLIQIQS